MDVENFWKQLKHEYLHHYAHPRFDQLVWILVYRVTLLYLARMEILKDTAPLGRSKPLTTYQHYFKESWLKLKLLDAIQLRRNANKYITTPLFSSVSILSKPLDCHLPHSGVKLFGATANRCINTLDLWARDRKLRNHVRANLLTQ